ncbi:MAG: transcriptional regulator [Gammaproteobacteria bacterium]|nr:transcriptional regulator [Gammaproteobacteria bacterium]MBU1655102.1 transcriptional regulator [Gammaproteobacteria bacterium]MBU1961574.1 transcriptional regulator [Gammaproteobacteria bacterium]
MQIQGPLKFSVAAAEGADAGYELFLDFTEGFRHMTLEMQGAEFRNYLNYLGELLVSADLDERNRQGMLMVQQIAEQLLPHVENGELALNETINIHIRADSPQVSLVDLLRQVQQ